MLSFFSGTSVCDVGQTVLSLENICDRNASVCQDRSDDSLCKCLSKKWKCKTDDRCIDVLEGKLCDTINDCNDKSDEDPEYCEQWVKCIGKKKMYQGILLWATNTLQIRRFVCFFVICYELSQHLLNLRLTIKMQAN